MKHRNAQVLAVKPDKAGDALMIVFQDVDDRKDLSAYPLWTTIPGLITQLEEAINRMNGEIGRGAKKHNVFATYHRTISDDDEERDGRLLLSYKEVEKLLGMLREVKRKSDSSP